MWLLLNNEKWLIKDFLQIAVLVCNMQLGKIKQNIDILVYFYSLQQ